MQNLIYDMVQLCKRYPENTYITRDNRLSMLTQMAEQLLAQYPQLRAWQVKGRHWNWLLTLWRQQGMTDDVIANRASVFRWWCRKVNRASVMPKTNAPFGLQRTPVRATVSRAIELDWLKWGQIRDAYVRMSVELQVVFGLRCKEALMLRPNQADGGHELRLLHKNWTKGNVPRVVPITRPEQREVLDRAKALVQFKERSLIPKGMSFYQQRNRYYTELARVGLETLHGLRHAYAQGRYEALAAVAAPVHGGPRPMEVDRSQQRQLLAARRQVSAELGHHRPHITTRYTG